jgi:hypothetical protein
MIMTRYEGVSAGLRKSEMWRPWIFSKKSVDRDLKPWLTLNSIGLQVTVEWCNRLPLVDMSKGVDSDA